MPSHRALSLGFVVLSLLSACARVEPTIAAATPAVTTHPPLPSRTPTSEPAPTFTPTAQAVCRERAGRVLADEIMLPEDTRPLVYRLYLPPCFDPGRAARYPTLYLMHGLAQSESEWVDLGIAATADTLIAQGSIPAMVIVMPGERTGYDMLVALTDTLLPHIEQSMPTGGTPELRAIGGLSHGGGWALRIGFRHPELFTAIGLHSPAVISPDLYLLPTWATEIPSQSIPRLWIDIGSEDTLFPGALDLRARLDKLHWPYTWVQNPGEHTAAYWSEHLAEYLGWYAQVWPSRGPAE